MLNFVNNRQHSLNMSDFTMGILHAKFLNYLDKKGKKIERKKITFYAEGKTQHAFSKALYIDELKKEQAIIEKDKKIHLTSKGEELLKNNQHLLKRFVPDKRKTRCNKGIPTSEDIFILNYVKDLIANNSLNTFKLSETSNKLNITKQLISRRLKRLKDAGIIDYTPRKMHTIRILKGN